MSRVSIAQGWSVVTSTGSLQVWQIIIEKIRLEGALEVSLCQGRKAPHAQGEEFLCPTRIALFPIWVQSLVLQEEAGSIFSIPPVPTAWRSPIPTWDLYCCSQHVKVATRDSSGGTEQSEIGKAWIPVHWNPSSGFFSLGVCGAGSRVRLQRWTRTPGLDLNSRGVWLLSSERSLQLCLSEPPPGPMEWRSQGSIEQLVTAHLQQALQVMLIINSPKRVYRDELIRPQIKWDMYYDLLMVISEIKMKRNISIVK